LNRSWRATCPSDCTHGTRGECRRYFVFAVPVSSSVLLRKLTQPLNALTSGTRAVLRGVSAVRWMIGTAQRVRTGRFLQRHDQGVGRDCFFNCWRRSIAPSWMSLLESCAAGAGACGYRCLWWHICVVQWRDRDAPSGLSRLRPMARFRKLPAEVPWEGDR
jgi:hypothetical protein